MLVKIKTGEDLKDLSVEIYNVAGFVTEQKHINTDVGAIPYSEHQAILVDKHGRFLVYELALLKWVG